MIAAPFIGPRGEVRPGWVDENLHLNLAYYLVLFDAGSDALFEALGIGTDYRRDAGCACFATESHLVYEREMRLGDVADIVTTVLDADEKRLHVAHEMVRDGERVCLQEIMFVNVDLATRRGVPWGDSVRARIEDAVAAHRGVRVAKVGRAVGIKHS